MIAINILLLPDEVTVQKAKADNARLRQNYPQGYALDAEHVPHITLVQRFVSAKHLDGIAAVCITETKSEHLFPIELTATGYGMSVSEGMGILVYIVKRTPELLRLEQRIVEAVRPFAVSGGTANAFVRVPNEQIKADTVEWVEKFVPNSSGDNYLPHLTIGMAHQSFVKRLEAQRFQKFKFRAVDIAIYQLGNFGTAQKRLLN